MAKRKSTDMVDMARGRLAGVLQDLIDPSEEEEESDEPHYPGVPQRGRPRLKKPQPASKELVGSPKVDKKVYGSYVLKLFDRSLDLSKYDNKTALYPICRAWMVNTPRSGKLKSFREADDRRPPKREDAPDFVDKLKRGDIHEVRLMPGTDDVGGLASHPVVETKKGINFQLPLPSASKEKLLADHKEHWKRSGAKWKAHVNEYNSRKYRKSKKLIEALFSV